MLILSAHTHTSSLHIFYDLLYLLKLALKFQKNAEKLLKLIEGVYRYLPLGTIVNNKVLIVHGGISDSTDLEMIRSLDRGKVFDILWSDPQEVGGCVPNTLRGAGTYFGPDITKRFLEQNRLLYIIRSHECKPDGYEVCHNNSVITIFSASNYYEVGSNNGAYLKLVGPELDTHYVQYMASSGKRKLTFYQRMGLVESGAARELKMQIMNNRHRIEAAFAESDPENTGYISITEWCVALEKATGLCIPWRMLKDKLVTIDPETNRVKYQTTFDIKSDKLNVGIIGYITLDEFSDACNLIKKHMPCPMTHEQLEDICKLMDLNKDGLVDLNEFLESFRMVDPESKRKNEPDSPEPCEVADAPAHARLQAGDQDMCYMP
ncbi:hypothetical protein NQ318_020704 [Aromia moschata]|uniref:EF-hand domain-containing protein n=1 Tax=Aromia moschata TaxID=1265417 RepID=A0AAV8YWU0_9CUCU|nr:hypothetical protein NQ318_020704 [Aromia moschata]